jgi:hypothetical protein
MKKSATLFVLAGCLTALMSQTVVAANRAGAFTITPGVAYDFFSAKRNLNNAWLLPTVQLAYDFDEKWAAEFMYGTFGTSQSIAGGTGSATGDLYTMDGLYRFGTYYSMVQPYISFGVGATHINPNGSSAENIGNINAGLGAQVFFDKSVAFRAEARDIYTMSGGKNDVTLGIGVSYLIGGDAPQPMPVYKDQAPLVK